MYHFFQLILRLEKRILIKIKKYITHQDINFSVNLKTKVTFDTFLAENIDVDFLVLAAKPAHFRLPLFHHIHSYVFVSACLHTRFTIARWESMEIHACRFVSHKQRFFLYSYFYEFACFFVFKRTQQNKCPYRS